MSLLSQLFQELDLGSWERSYVRTCELEGCLKLLRGETRPVGVEPSPPRRKTLVVSKVNGVVAVDVEAVAAEEEVDGDVTVVVADSVAEIEDLATIVDREVTSPAIARTREWKGKIASTL
jgi:hypothetical protein